MNEHSTIPVSEPLSLDLRGAFVRRTSLRKANLTNANLRGADCTGVDFSGANFAGAVLEGTILREANLTGALNLTIEQLRSAVIDEATVLPDYISRSALRGS